jgi:hypothetical protein
MKYQIQVMSEGSWVPVNDTDDPLDAVFSARWCAYLGDDVRILSSASEGEVPAPVYYATWYYSVISFSFQDPLLADKYSKYHRGGDERVIIDGEIMATHFRTEIQLHEMAWHMPKEAS